MSAPAEEESNDDGGNGGSRAKREFLKRCADVQKELMKRQREYKKINSVRLRSRSEQIIDKSYAKTIEKLTGERNNLRAKLWVANAQVHNRKNERYLTWIRCHIRCQERLYSNIRELKIDINNLEVSIGRTDKMIYKLNLQTVPDKQYQEFVKQARTKMSIMENQLEIGIRRECEVTAANAEMRRELKSLLRDRSDFHNLFAKYIGILKSESKYLHELIKYASDMFEDCHNFQEKVNLLFKKGKKERDRLKDDYQTRMQNSAHKDEAARFIRIKNNYRHLKPLDPKEVERRKEFVRVHKHKIDLYKSVFEKLLDYTETKRVAGIINKFTNQENLYYSYCSISNEIDFHITLLTNAVNQLYDGIKKSKANVYRAECDQNKQIDELKKALKEQQSKNEKLKATLETKDHKLKIITNQVEDIFNLCRCKPRPLLNLLGNYEKVDVSNVRMFFKVLEKRVREIVANVYISERTDKEKNNDILTVKNIYKIQESLTDLDDIVVAQQCPECAEGEAMITDDVGGDIVHVMGKQEVIKMISEKVNQPEMQYRLHNISQCRLPKSRLLTANRYV